MSFIIKYLVLCLLVISSLTLAVVYVGTSDKNTKNPEVKGQINKKQLNNTKWFTANLTAA